MDDSYKLNLIRFENKEMRIIGKEAAMLRLQQKAVLRADSEQDPGKEDHDRPLPEERLRATPIHSRQEGYRSPANQYGIGFA